MTALPDTHQRLVYYINLDERGSFYADVRQEANDKTVFEIRDGGRSNGSRKLNRKEKQHGNTRKD